MVINMAEDKTDKTLSLLVKYGKDIETMYKAFGSEWSTYFDCELDNLEQYADERMGVQIAKEKQLAIDTQIAEKGYALVGGFPIIAHDPTVRSPGMIPIIHRQSYGQRD